MYAINNERAGTCEPGYTHRLYTFQARSHTLAYGYEGTNFFKHAQNFVRIRTYGLYDKHTLGTR
jgi:hypothetical protein